MSQRAIAVSEGLQMRSTRCNAVAPEENNVRQRDEVTAQRGLVEKRLILDHIAQHIAFQDLDCRFIWVNRALCRDFRLQPEQLIGRRCYRVLYGRDAPCEGCPVILARHTGIAHESQLVSPDGRIWRIKGVPVRDGTGNITGVIEITLNITDHIRLLEQARRNEQYFRCLVHTLPYGVLETDLQGQIRFTNRAFEHLFEYAGEALQGKSFYDLLVKAEDRRRTALALSRILKHRPSPKPLEMQALTRNGADLCIRVDWNYLYDEPYGLKGFLAVVTNLAGR